MSTRRFTPECRDSPRYSSKRAGLASFGPRCAVGSGALRAHPISTSLPPPIAADCAATSSTVRQIGSSRSFRPTASNGTASRSAASMTRSAFASTGRSIMRRRAARLPAHGGCRARVLRGCEREPASSSAGGSSVSTRRAGGGPRRIDSLAGGTAADPMDATGANSQGGAPDTRAPHPTGDFRDPAVLAPRRGRRDPIVLLFCYLL